MAGLDREPELAGQTVVVIGGSSGIGLETARRARREGADVVLVGRDHERLKQAASEVDALEVAAFDASDPAEIEAFFRQLPPPIDHVMVTAGAPHYGRMIDMDFETARDQLCDHPLLYHGIARNAVGRVRAGGALVFMGGTGGRRAGFGWTSVGTTTLQSLVATLALEVAPIRVNLIAAGFVDTPLSASLLGDDLDQRRQELRDKLPIGRVVGPDDIAALALHIMTNTALTGATFDIDGGQSLVGI
jgi:NAD(P)-dependent dehydrogenase (short-subunit alcohol dehydrogenase family)